MNRGRRKGTKECTEKGRSIGRERGKCRRRGQVGKRLKGIVGSGAFRRTRKRVQTFYKYTAKCLEKGKEGKIKARKHIGGRVQKENNDTDGTIKPTNGKRKEDRREKPGKERNFGVGVGEDRTEGR